MFFFFVCVCFYGLQRRKCVCVAEKKRREGRREKMQFHQQLAKVLNAQAHLTGNDKTLDYDIASPLRTTTTKTGRSRRRQQLENPSSLETKKFELWRIRLFYTHSSEQKKKIKIVVWKQSALLLPQLQGCRPFARQARTPSVVVASHGHRLARDGRHGPTPLVASRTRAVRRSGECWRGAVRPATA